MKLLIAEDDLTSRTILTAVTRKWGFDPVAVEDGEAAWQVMQGEQAPRLLLIDWMMPKLDGLALCKRIRRQHSGDPPFIILLTARSETVDIVTGLEAGANEYIAKPFENAELQARLRVGQRILDLQDELRRANDILAAEREVIENIILEMRTSKRLDSAGLRLLQEPVEKTSGDILLSAFRPDKAQHLMLGDFTGHGLPAAIGGPIVSDIFYTMTAKGLPMEIIISEINGQLCEKMPTGLFLAAILIEIDPGRRQLNIWNCSMQEVFIFRHHVLRQTVASVNLALGILDQPLDRIPMIEVDAGDRIYAYSDGITEASNSEDEEFGTHRLEQAISELLSSQGEIEVLIEAVREFRGGGDQLDDISLVELSC
ncbi:MAG: SpoIIE family protein phosphatase [Gammaproteobacteria bacterium]|nr:SpoIIE family protein phosphatase [Gammaproteobacteria bacterium]